MPALLGGHLLQGPAEPAAAVRHLVLDSRRAGPPAGALFVALRGPSHDGHRYLPQAYAQGLRLFVVEENAALPGGLAAYPDAGLVAVASPLGPCKRWPRRTAGSLGAPCGPSRAPTARLS
ncbi:hypothetical protein BEN49_18860 [Hymenobacter coccineus]|uniref:Mur ligase N-terminal catalytic domain-containing protein n=1 Tax=Hymenobacter coccineus TaxID=1908235 RepID=A0A1G1TLF8_9BACT|nr:hypothetical protein BEN49_18860 [Hymenobacter coccineus]